MNRRDSGMVLMIVVMLAGVAALLAAGLYMAGSATVASTAQTVRFEKAFWIAEAGAERAKAVLRTSTQPLSTTLKGPDATADTADDGQLSFGASVPFAGGVYRVRVVDNADSDTNRFTDTDQTVIIRSTGVYERVERVLELAVCISNPLAPPADADGAVSVYGTNAEVQITGDARIDGRDYSVPPSFLCSGSGCSGALTTNPTAPGVFSSVTSTLVSAGGSAEILGNPPTTNGATGLYSESYYENLVAGLMGCVAITIPGGVIGGNVVLGTRAQPVISLITGAARITGNVDGAGILLVTAGVEIDFTGTFHYEGLVIMIGDGAPDASIEFNDKGHAMIFGSLIAIGGELDLNPQGSPSIMYSREALANLANLQMPPGELTVQYWREVKAAAL